MPVAVDCCTLCTGNLERVAYFPRQLLTADDMHVEQEYFRHRLRRHNRYLHGWGVVCGLTVEAAPATQHPWQVRVCPGLALSPQGDEALVDECVLFDLKLGMPTPEPCAPKWPCPPTGAMPGRDQRARVYLAVRYAECPTRPVRVPPAGCGCDAIDCEYSRIRDSFELKVLWELPESHAKAKAADKAWADIVRQLPANREQPRVWPKPPCPDCESDPWVVIATIQLPASEKTQVAAADITFGDCRVLLPTQAIQVALTVL